MDVKSIMHFLLLLADTMNEKSLLENTSISQTLSFTISESLFSRFINLLTIGSRTHVANIVLSLKVGGLVL